MELNEFIEKFAEIFEETEIDTLSGNTHFRDLEEWSSLSALGLMAMADEEFDVELKGEEIRSANTIEDIFNLIKSKA